MMRQNKTLAIGLAAVVGASAAGWTAGRQIRSPAQEAANTAAPDPSMITVSAERRVLTADVTGRGTVRFGAPQVVSLPVSGLKKNTAVVTSTPVKGAAVNEGSALLTISGRPVLAMQGEAPAHRDMGPGVVGDDVRQLEEGLARLGFSPGAIDGTYDDRTSTAVTAWYLSLGWTPFGPTEEQLTVLRATQGDLFSAESELLNAQDTLSTAQGSLASAQDKALAARAAASVAPSAVAVDVGKLKAERMRADADVAKAAEAVETAIENETIAKLRLAEARSPGAGFSEAQIDGMEAAVARATAAIPVAQAALDAAIAGQEASRRAGVVAVRTKQRALDAQLNQTPQDPISVEMAREDLAAAEAQAEADRLKAAADVSARQADLDDADAILRNARLVLAEATAPAGPAVTGAELASLSATARQASSAVSGARTDLAVANAMLAALSASPTPAGAAEAARAATTADEEVTRAAQATTLAQRRVALVSSRATQVAVTKLGGKLGTQVPADELVFFPGLPVRVDESKVKVGDQVAGPAFTVTNSQLAVDGALSVDDAKLVRKGAAVAIRDADLGVEAAGVVTEIAETPGTNGVDPGRFYLQVTPGEGAAGLVLGASVVLTITVDSTEGEVLTVPVAALSVAADGTPRAQVRKKDGTTRFVKVTPGLTSQGVVAVTPLDGQSLTEKDLVVVGTAGTGLDAPLGRSGATTSTTSATSTTKAP